ncbi:hypothetical protein Tco_1098350 [Tanacetum coccineum]
MGPFIPSSSPKGGKEITDSEEKVWIILYLATLYHGCTIRIASGLSFHEVHALISGSVVATENTGSDVVVMENEDSDGDGTVNGGVGYGEVIVKV